MPSMEELADLLMAQIEGWQTYALKRIGKDIKKVGGMTQREIQELNNIALVNESMEETTRELAKVLKTTVPEVEKMYAQALEQTHLANEYLYDYRGKTFVPFEETAWGQAMVQSFAQDTANTMINLTQTTATGLKIDGRAAPTRDAYLKALDKATVAVTSGGTDFYTAMRGAIKEMGGSGILTNYSGYYRRLDTSVRQSMLWGMKQVQTEYQKQVGRELGCDGIEIDWHSNPRPSHEFMQGKQYSTVGTVRINGVTYEDAQEAVVYDALQDYGCLHVQTAIILGVSEPRYSDEELQQMNRINDLPVIIDGESKTGYEWKQDMRVLETEVRKQTGVAAVAKGAGNTELVQKANARIAKCKERYKVIAEGANIKETPQRMKVVNPTKVGTRKT